MAFSVVMVRPKQHQIYSQVHEEARVLPQVVESKPATPCHTESCLSEGLVEERDLGRSRLKGREGKKERLCFLVSSPTSLEKNFTNPSCSMWG